ncbi:beta strand repeat-containing protein [Thalassoroseus pseudoceratinae]|uniref:beta strand repeat-containing protein n=1 Tax=Thalassoroseus pseudoceratinae TaxID=2713176 RepID=UPI0014225EBE|nr:choice-of-anchor Q domain-containing protein [Thalassoroseus pseudoceratinae]
MLTFDWLTDLRNNARLPWNRRARHSRRHLAKRTSVLPASSETLEDRTLLTQFVVTTLDDEDDFGMGAATDVDGAGGENDLSLREAIRLANETVAGAGGAGVGDDQGELDGDTIVFDPSLAGGTITLMLGTLDISDDVTIDGEMNNITIDGDGMSGIFQVGVALAGGSANDVGISNLTLTGGNAGLGGALFIQTGALVESTVTVDTVTFTDNTATNSGGAIADISSNAALPTLNVVDSIFMGNEAEGSTAGEGGGAIALSSTGGGVNITGSTFDSNVAIGGAAGSGGGAILNVNAAAAPVTIEDSTFTTNLAGDSDDDGMTDQAADGGAILNEGVLTIDAMMGGTTTFTGNSAGRAGGAIENSGSVAVLTLNDVDFGGMTPADGNNADVNGGAIHQSGDATVTINGGTFQNNTAGEEGGALWNSGTGTMTLDDTLAAILIDSNVASGPDADQGGGGIFQQAGTATLTIAPTTNGITISNNVADGTSGSGGGIFVDDGATLVIDGTAAAVMITGNVANRAGGGIEDNSGSMTTTLLTNVNLDGNSAGVDISAPVGTAPVANPGNGGGLHVTGPGDVTIDGGTVNNNVAASEGGGLWNGTGTMTIQNGTVIDSNTASGAGADNGGGGIFNAGGTLIIDGTMAAVEITNNTADGNAGSGGGILNDASGTLSIDTATISSNTANRAGGGIETTGGTDVTLTNVTLGGMTSSEGNTALGIAGDAATNGAGNGGGLHITSDGVVTIDGGTIQYNSAAEGGGLWNSATGTLTLDDTNSSILIDSNTAFGNADPDASSNADLQGGGGIFSDGGDLILDGSTNGITISNNSATGADFGSGGGILAIGGAMATIDITTVMITDNTATRAGGGIEIVEAATVNLTSMTLSGNSATGTGAGPGNGGGLHTTGDVADLTVDDSLVQDNAAASEGGGLWFSSGTIATVQNGTDVLENTASGDDATNGGGGIFNAGGSLTIDGSMTTVTIADNAADGTSGSGGGIFNDAMGTLTINDASITGNVANRAGGGIEATAGTMTMLTDVALDGNSAGVDIMNMAGSTPVAAPGNGGGLHISGDGDVTVDGGTVSNNVAASEGGGLWNGLGEMTIQNGTVIDSNVASGAAADNGGGGVFNAGGTVTITGAATMITNNAADGASGSGGGILNDAMGTLSVTDAEISGNVANRAGGGIEVTASTTTTLTGVTLDGNSAGVDIMNMVGTTPVAAPGNGGGLHVSGDGDVTIDGGTVSGNVAASEGGGLWNGSGEMMIQNATVIDSNVASGDDATNGGGGVFNAGGEVTIINSTISNNAADGTSGSGGGIFNDAMGTLTVIGGFISDNVANRAGGGIETTAGTTTTLSNVTIGGNSAGVDIMAPVGTTPVAAPGNGGGLHVTGDGNVNVTGGIFQNNVAALEGGGLWNGSGTMTVNGTVVLQNIASGDAADDGGGGIFNNGGTLDIDNATISQNEADGTLGSGGGILSLGGTVTIDNTSITSNSANRAGGGIEMNGGTATISGAGTQISGNDVNGGGTTAIAPNPGNGGGLHITGDAMVTIDSGTVSNNEAAAEGGGLWNSSTGTLIVQNGTIIDGNLASGNADGSTDTADLQGGGGIFNDGGTLIINGTASTVSITNNLANGASGMGLTAGSGGGILSIGGSVTIAGASIDANEAIRAGGGIEVVAGLVNIVDSDLTNNDVSVAGGSISVAAPGNGGGLHVTSDATVNVIGGTVDGNTAESEGGGLWNSSTGTLTVGGDVTTGNVATTREATGADAAAITATVDQFRDDLGTLNSNTPGSQSPGRRQINWDAAPDSVSAPNSFPGDFFNANFSPRARGVEFTTPGTDFQLSATAASGEGVNFSNINSNYATDFSTFSAERLFTPIGSNVVLVNFFVPGTDIPAAVTGFGAVFSDVDVDDSTMIEFLDVDDNVLATQMVLATAGDGSLSFTGLTFDAPVVASVRITSGNGNLAMGNDDITQGGTDDLVVMDDFIFGEPVPISVMSMATTISNNIASGDDATNGGGGIFNDGGTLTITGGTISGNIADGTSGSGGGIFSVDGTVTISNTEISGNEAVRAGGGIEIVTGTVTLTDVTLDGNDASDDDLTGNGLLSNPGNGGGLHITGDGDMGMTTPTTVTISGGSVSDNTAGSEGGGLWNNVGATLIVQNGTAIEGNIASGDAADEGGGGIFNNGGTLQVDGATIQFNVADGTAGSGGGILTTDGSVTIDNTTISLNGANRAGGGIEAIAGTVALTNVQLISNDVDGTATFGTPNPGNGGGLHAASADVTITGSNVLNNLAAEDGGGLWIGTGTLTVDTTTVDANEAGAEGGGAYNQNGTLTVTNSLFTANFAVDSGGAIQNGGAASAATTSISNSTISGNDSDGNGGGITNDENSTLTITNATIVLNTADSEDDATGAGGGIFTDATSTTTLNNTILAGNTTGGGVDSDFDGMGAADASSANNLLGDAGTSGIMDATNGNIVGITGGLATVLDPTLANNGGLTETHALVMDSPAVNAGSNSLVDASVDQRGTGFPRILNGIVDIGALESVFGDPGALLDDFDNDFVDPLAINGPYTQVVAGDFDGVQLVTGGDGNDDLFFWDPVSGENRIVLRDGTIITNPVDPSAINGNDFANLVSGAFDGDPNDDLFFWDPASGKNRLVHLDVDKMTMPITITGVVEDSVVPDAAINGNDFTELVAGDLDEGDADDLFFWNPVTGRNRLVHLTAVTPAADTEVSNIQTNVVDVTAINGNDFEDVVLGDFDNTGSNELFFTNLTTGRNRLVSFDATTPGVTSAQDTVLTNVIDVTALNGNDFSEIVIADVNGDDIVDVFARDFASGKNRLFTNDGDGSSYTLTDSPVAVGVINGDFPVLTPVTIETASSAITDGLFFWNPVTGKNRIVSTDFVV